jgi:hypothetical protein
VDGQQHRSDEKGQAQSSSTASSKLSVDGSLDVGGKPEFRIRKSTEDGGGTAFAVTFGSGRLIEMKKRGVNLATFAASLQVLGTAVPRPPALRRAYLR